MDIESINNLKFNNNEQLFNLFEPSFYMRDDIDLNEYIVSNDDEMRIDIIFKNIYNIENNQLHNYLKDIDVLLYINSIDNPIDIKNGKVIKYPLIGQLSSYRYNPLNDNINNELISQLAIPNLPNKTTNIDNNRRLFLESDYSLSPVLSSRSENSVRIENGNFTIGGIN